MAKLLQKERENRSADKKDIAFHPYTITAETAPTAVLLLDSFEPEILCQTLRAITRFQAQDMANRFVIFNVDGIKKILPHIENSEVNVRRFALKALAQLCALPRGPEQVVEDRTNMRKITTILTKSEDIYVQEFSSLLLAELTLEPKGCDQLVNVNILSTLFNRMKTSLDPDVQKNCLQTLSNLLADPVCSSVVTKNHQFHWPSILVLMQSKYLGIQHAALRTVDQLICRYKDEAVQKTFRASTGILDLCDILESYEFRDVHAMVLGVLKNYVETEDNALHAYQSGCVLRLLAYLDMALPVLKPNCLAVLAKMSFTENGRDALFQTGTDLVFCQQLLSSNINLLADAALGVANMTKILPSAVRMSETNIIEALCAILSDEGAAWFYIRMNALLALSELCRIIPKAAFNLVEPKTFGSLRAINKRPKENPIEAQRLAAHCYKNLLNYHISTRAMLTKDFFHELFATMQRPDILLKIAIADVLSGLMNSEPTMEDMGKSLFSSACGEQILSDNLRIEHVALRTALCTLMALSISDEGSEVYLANGTIHYMFHNRVARSAVPAWEAALEAVFRHNASAKLHYTGKLDINDFTQEGFYVQKRKDEQLPPLIELVKEPAPHLNPVLMAAFLWPTPSDMGQAVERQNVQRERKSTGSLRNSMTVVSEYHIPIDHNMREYVQQLAVWFGDPGKSAHYIDVEDANFIVRYREKCNEASSTLKKKAQLLAEFVILQMCGLDQERDCSMPSVELHLADLMDELELCVIGLGWIRAGGALERALLYKVLADRHGIPCSLRRPNSGHAWCEVAVPEMEPDDNPDKDERYPAGLLRVNYIVDLLHPVGRLVKAGSYEAHTITQGTREIRGPYSF